jgi:hypothetical protein
MSFKLIFGLENTPLTPLKGGIAKCSNFSNALLQNDTLEGVTSNYFDTPRDSRKRRKSTALISLLNHSKRK